MADLQEEMVAAADAQVRRMRREVVASLANAHEKLMESPARERDVLDEGLRRDLRIAVSMRTVEFAIDQYQTVSELSAVEVVQKEMVARVEHLRAFQDAIVQAVEDKRPWLAAMSVTTGEVVSPENLSELQETHEWGLMQQASVEATVSCMPPSPKGWFAADGAGAKRLEAHNADVAAWMVVDQPPLSERSDEDPVAAGHLLREAIGSRVKVSCQRTDRDALSMEDAYSKLEYSEAHQTRLVSQGVPDGADLEQEPFVEVPYEHPAGTTSDWWALRNGIPVEIDSFPAPNESVQQHADVRFKLPRPVWEASREYMGPAFEHVVVEGENDVDVTVSAQQRAELIDRAEDVQFRTVYTAQEQIEFIQSGDDYGRDGGETVGQVEELRGDAERVAYQCSVVVGALNSAKPVTMNDTAATPSVESPLVAPPTASPIGASADMGR